MTLYKHKVITVKARKRLNNLLESKHTYYRLYKPDTWYDFEESYYVLREVKKGSHLQPQYQIISCFRI